MTLYEIEAALGGLGAASLLDAFTKPFTNQSAISTITTQAAENRAAHRATVTSPAPAPRVTGSVAAAPAPRVAPAPAAEDAPTSDAALQSLMATSAALTQSLTRPRQFDVAAPVPRSSSATTWLVPIAAGVVALGFGVWALRRWSSR